MAVLTPQREDFPRWYQDVLTKAKLAENGPARGTMVIRPTGYAIWERMQAEVDGRIKAAGAQNAYFPLADPDELLRARGRARRGVQSRAGRRHARRRQGVDRAARHPADQRDGHRRIHGQMGRQLPRPAAASQSVGERRAVGDCGHESSCAPRSSCGRKATPRTPPKPTRGSMPAASCATCTRISCATCSPCPVIVGRKTAKERFAGAQNTMTCEGIMRDGKALQMGTSHELGQRFSRAFNISYSQRRGRDRALLDHLVGCVDSHAGGTDHVPRR